MYQLTFISYTSASGKAEAVSAADIARVGHATDGSILLLRDGSFIQTQDTVATIQSRLDALREASSQVIITDGITAPGATAGIAKIYVDTSDGDLKVVFADGTVKTIVTDT